ncbi:hypothetical protein, partial [Gracilibacillus alcaliphilus]|uniref:hypothetical protein n=1 Tax=Gracilibacillus alcaliphilus TaxID=1401441 RepID=UPI00195D59F9
HMCRVPSQNGIPSILAENGFMTNLYDFEWIFGSKKDEYAERCATAAFNAIQRFLGGTVEQPDNKTAGVSTDKPSKPKQSSKSIKQMATEVIQGKHGSGHANRRKSLGISQSEYEKVRAEVNRRSGVSTSKSKSKNTKTIAQMATEVINGRHGSGHANRRQSLGISQAQYAKVRAEVNRRAGGGSASGKSISQMATEVIQGKHGSGHENRRKSLGISKAEYEKVRKEVNKRLK